MPALNLNTVMKNQIIISSRFTIAAAMLATFVFAQSASALDFFPKRSPTPASASHPAAGTPKSATAKTQPGAGNLSATDKAFMKKAAKGGMMEVAMGKMAEEKGQSEDVKAFGKRMVTDHSKANTELMSLAEKKGVKLPTEKAAKEWTSDKDYMDAMVKDHEKDLAEFQGEANNGSDPDLKKFAERTAKVVEGHLKMARETQGKLK
jgi:putative membrane protein